MEKKAFWKMRVMAYHVLAVAIGILLFIAGVTDIRKRQINRGLLLMLMLVCLAEAVFKEDFGIMDAAGGLAIGLCTIGVSIASREQIGRGDGMVIAMLGFVMGVRKCLAVVGMASVLMCMAAIVVLVMKKGNRRTRLAFLPALFAGYVLCIVGGC